MHLLLDLASRNRLSFFNNCFPSVGPHLSPSKLLIVWSRPNASADSKNSGENFKGKWEPIPDLNFPKDVFLEVLAALDTQPSFVFAGRLAFAGSVGPWGTFAH